MEQLKTDLKKGADRLISSLGTGIESMGKKFTVESVKKDTEIVANIRNNGVAISSDYKNLGAVVDRIKKYEHPVKKPDPKLIAHYT